MTHLITQSLESTLPLGDKNLVGDGCIYLFAEDAVFCCKALDFCWGRGSFLSCLQSSQRCALEWNISTLTRRLATPNFCQHHGVPKKKSDHSLGFYHISKNVFKNAYTLENHRRKVHLKITTHWNPEHHNMNHPPPWLWVQIQKPFIFRKKKRRSKLGCEVLRIFYQLRPKWKKNLGCTPMTPLATLSSVPLQLKALHSSGAFQHQLCHEKNPRIRSIILVVSYRFL